MIDLLVSSASSSRCQSKSEGKQKEVIMAAAAASFDILRKATSIPKPYTVADLERLGLAFDPKPDFLLIFHLFNKLIGKPQPTEEIVKQLVSRRRQFPDPTFISAEHFAYGKKYNKAFFYVLFEENADNSSVRMTATGNYWKLEKEEEVKHVHNGQEIHIGTAKTFKYWKFTIYGVVPGVYEMTEYKLLDPQALGIDARMVKESPFSDLLQLYSLVAITCEDGELEKVKRGIVAPPLVIGGAHQIVLPADADIGARGSVAPLVDYIAANPESPTPSPPSPPRVGPFGAIPDPRSAPTPTPPSAPRVGAIPEAQPALAITMGTDGHISSSSASPSKRPRVL